MRIVDTKRSVSAETFQPLLQITVELSLEEIQDMKCVMGSDTAALLGEHFLIALQEAQ